MDLKKTPLYQAHLKSGAKAAPFGGWLMPIQYRGIIEEHNWTRESASVFDICHMGEFILEGDLAASNLDTVVTVGLTDMPEGSCRYGFMLNPGGGIIDDLLVYRIEKDKWMLVVNAATTDKDEAHLRKNLSKDCRLENISERTAKLDIQGPLSFRALKEVFSVDLHKLKYYSFGLFDLFGEKCIISRTGYTGELGFELYVSSSRAADLWDLILSSALVRPAGLGARDTLRLEMGYALYGQDIDENITPIQAGLEKFLDYKKDFIGKEALLKEKSAGAAKKAVFFRSVNRRAPRHNYRIHDNGIDIGSVTSGSFSPSLGCGIGMGYVAADLGEGKEIFIKENGLEIVCRISDKPFYKHGSAKAVLSSN